MNRIAPILLALGLACLISPFGSESLPLVESPASEMETGTMVLLAAGVFASLVGAANLIRRYSQR
jgi:hypothetical protein